MTENKKFAKLGQHAYLLGERPNDEILRPYIETVSLECYSQWVPFDM